MIDFWRKSLDYTFYDITVIANQLAIIGRHPVKGNYGLNHIFITFFRIVKKPFRIHLFAQRGEARELVTIRARQSLHLQ